MNKYKVTIKTTDGIGIKWLHNVVKYAGMGGKIEDRFYTKVSFPQEVTLVVETEDHLETDKSNGVTVFPVMEAKSKEEMEAMPWEAFKKECRTWGVGGRHRDTMLSQYIKATNQEDGYKVVEKPPKKPTPPPSRSVKGEKVVEVPSTDEVSTAVEQPPVLEQPTQ